MRNVDITGSARNGSIVIYCLMHLIAEFKEYASIAMVLE